MLKRIVLAAVATISAGSAFAAPPVWVGGFLVVGVAGTACDQANIQVNEMYTAVFHPKLAGDTTVPADVFQILVYQKGFRFVPSGTVHFGTSGNYSTAEWTARATIKNFTGTYSNLAVSPAPTAATKFINMSGTFAKIDNLDCAVTFASGLTLKQ